MIHKTFSAPLEVKELESSGMFSGYASVFYVTDFQQDQIMPGAFTGSLKKWQSKNRWPFLLWQHDIRKPIGVWKHMEENHKGLFVVGQLLLDLQQGKEAYTLMKVGALEGLSIGFHPIVAKRDRALCVRKIFQVDLVEISVVTQAANPEARLESVKRKP